LQFSSDRLVKRSDRKLLFFKEKKMKKTRIFCIALLLCFCLGFAWAEETELVPSRTIRLSLAPSFGFQLQKWEGLDAEKVMAFNTGLGLEYSVNDWIGVQALWIPGVNAWSSTENGGTYGLLSDIYGGPKFSMIGSASPIKREDMRLAIAAGLIMPLPSTDSSGFEGDRHLWGSSLEVYFDYIFTEVFYLNLYTQMVFYPDQRYIGPNYFTRSVFHPLDLSFELEPRFRHEAGNGVVLHWGLPVNFSVAPWLNYNDADREGTELCLSAGAFFTASFTSPRVPFDISARYTAPAWGRYVQPVHRVDLTGRIYFKL
jgi:hypothetical protein